MVQAAEAGTGWGAEHIGSCGYCRVSGFSSECDSEPLSFSVATELGRDGGGQGWR